MRVKTKTTDLNRLTGVLHEGLDHLAGEHSREQGLAAILAHCCQWVGACRGHLWEYQDESAELTTVASYALGQTFSGPGPDAPEFLCKPFPAEHNGSFYSLCLNEKMRPLGPEGFLDTVWAGTREWHARHRHRCGIALPLLAQGEGLGKMALYFDHERAWDEPDIEALPALATQAALVLLVDKLQRQRYASLLREERNRFAREIHDGLAQNLISILMRLRLQEPRDRELEDLTQLALEEARRTVFALRPLAVEQSDLPGAFESLLSRQPGVETELCIQGTPRSIPENWKHELYRVVQEGVCNTVRHSCASRLWIHLTYLADGLEVVLGDNGRGFSLAQLRGHGLDNIRERVALLGGTVEWTSLPQQGTRLKLTIGWKARSPGPD
jgi:signal transduction histidine kinase